MVTRYSVGKGDHPNPRCYVVKLTKLPNGNVVERTSCHMSQAVYDSDVSDNIPKHVIEPSVKVQQESDVEPSIQERVTSLLVYTPPFALYRIICCRE
jgi:hypothetical protein